MIKVLVDSNGFPMGSWSSIGGSSLEGEGLRVQRKYHGQKVYTDSYMVDYGESFTVWQNMCPTPNLRGRLDTNFTRPCQFNNLFNLSMRDEGPHKTIYGHGPWLVGEVALSDTSWETFSFLSAPTSCQQHNSTLGCSTPSTKNLDFLKKNILLLMNSTHPWALFTEPGLPARSQLCRIILTNLNYPRFMGAVNSLSSKSHNINMLVSLGLITFSG